MAKPIIELDNKIELVDLIKSEAWVSLLEDVKVEVTEQIVTKAHKLSHQNLHIEFVHIRVEDKEFEKFSSLISVDRESAKGYPMPKPIEIHLARE